MRFCGFCDFSTPHEADFVTTTKSTSPVRRMPHIKVCVHSFVGTMMLRHGPSTAENTPHTDPPANNENKYLQSEAVWKAVGVRKVQKCLRSNLHECIAPDKRMHIVDALEPHAGRLRGVGGVANRMSQNATQPLSRASTFKCYFFLQGTKDTKMERYRQRESHHHINHAPTSNTVRERTTVGHNSSTG